MSVLLGLWGLAKRIPWQLWAALALVAAGWFYGNLKYADGRDAADAKWQARVVAAERKARDAERRAEAAHDQREVVREVHTNTIREVARKARDENPEAAGRSCGPVTSSVLGELRRQAADQQHAPARVD